MICIFGASGNTGGAAAAFLLKPLNLGKFLATVADTLGQRP